MERPQFSREVKRIAKADGLSVSGTVVWAGRGDLVAAFQMQAGRWGEGVYFNTGVLPRAMIVKRALPGAGYWCLGERASGIEGPWRRWFVDVEETTRGATETDVAAAIPWLCGHVRTYLDGEYIRAYYAKLPDDGAPDIMRDWLHGRLKDPRVYWPGAPYYR